VADPPPDFLARVAAFSDLSTRDLNELAASMRQRTYQAGRAIVTEGETGVGFFVVSDGTASVSVDGTEVGTLGPGDFFGEIALLTDRKRMATVTAVSELTCWGMPAWTFKPFVAAHPKVAAKLREKIESIVAERPS
jgi:CRP-like cAMP-binding protein